MTSLASQTFFLPCNVTSLPDLSFSVYYKRLESWGLGLGMRLQHYHIAGNFCGGRGGVGEGGKEEGGREGGGEG